ncbi:uncharacterized protein LOC126887919 [Diabrotica virgifera virgifera]|uniref:Uncharacterized protein n=1 Tax=Diabrotica virgifera virgifera TaxID=50390 RepID=A0ABM5KNN9_DIAVI|nr:uncharacterized protein LOC126887919 [Diabrotica virgifera virgifera]
MEKGKGNRYRGKKLSEINIDDNEYYSSEYEGDEEPIMQKVLKRVTRGKKPEDELDTGDSDRYVHQSTERDQHNENTLSRNYFKKATSPFHESNEENSEEPPTKKTKESSTKSIQRFRAKWSDNEKQVLLQYFEKHIKKKLPLGNMNVTNY